MEEELNFSDYFLNSPKRKPPLRQKGFKLKVL